MALSHCCWGTLRSECLGHKIGGSRPQCGPYLCFQTTGHRTQGEGRTGPIPESSPDREKCWAQPGRILESHLWSSSRHRAVKWMMTVLSFFAFFLLWNIKPQGNFGPKHLKWETDNKRFREERRNCVWVSAMPGCPRVDGEGACRSLNKHLRTFLIISEESSHADPGRLLAVWAITGNDYIGKVWPSISG